MTELIVICSWCDKIVSPGPCERELASINVELLERPGSPLVTHTICGDCSERFLAGEAA
jgi:hypothetical protein